MSYKIINDDLTFAQNLIDSIHAKEREIAQDERSSPHYWNGDGWGSISGFNDAEKWQKNELARFVNNQIKKRIRQLKRRTSAGKETA